MTDIVKVPADATDVCEKSIIRGIIVMFSANYEYLDILNPSSIERVVVNHRIDTIIHFSALLRYQTAFYSFKSHFSAVGEMNVPLALSVNCRGVENVLDVAK